MPEVSLNATDAAEPVEMLDLIAGWFTRDHAFAETVPAQLRRRPRLRRRRLYEQTSPGSRSCLAGTPVQWPFSKRDLGSALERINRRRHGQG